MSVPVINGTAVTVLGGSSDPTDLASFSTSGAGKVIVIALINGANVDGITGASLTFTERANNSYNGSNRLVSWAADSAGAISSQTISINLSAAPSYITAVVFGVGNTTGFDTDASLPESATDNADGTVSTDAADTMVIGAFRSSGTENSDPPATWTDIVTDGFMGVFYKTFTAIQSGLTVPRPVSDTVNGRICDALAGPVDSAAGTGLAVLRQNYRNMGYS